MTNRREHSPSPEPTTSQPKGLSRGDKLFFAGVPFVLGAFAMAFWKEQRTAIVSMNIPLQGLLITLTVLVGASVGFLRAFKRPYGLATFLWGVPLAILVSTVFVGLPAFLAVTLIDRHWVVGSHHQEVYVVDDWQETSSGGRSRSTYQTYLVRDAAGVETKIRFPLQAKGHLAPKTCQILTIRHGALGLRFIDLKDPVTPGNPGCEGRRNSANP